jgi:hypothetical protein
MCFVRFKYDLGDNVKFIVDSCENIPSGEFEGIIDAYGIDAYGKFYDIKTENELYRRIYQSNII